ncbi:hypothetical protein R1sor_009905 [Riccia sorocarpa]|uniref:Polymerase nucleotidyl transferase domain-containing protein n=1 Tax=Riccia sorocarpa TaxID=122646 RepID=A0ABD3HYF4_9MARC
METQQLMDALTDHLAIYHRSYSPSIQSKERQKVIEWLAGLNYEQRQAALTIVDGPWVSILLSMQKYLTTEGRGSFILLPDMPGGNRDNTGSEFRASNQKKGKLDGSTPDSALTVQQLNLGRPLVSKKSERVDKACTRCSSTLPGLCFRRARGLVRRLHKEEEAGNELVRSIRLFSSEDGEAKVGLGKADGGRMLDCISISGDLLKNMDRFLEVMDDLSHHEFLKSPYHFPSSPWEEMPWLRDMGYYSLPAFIVNKFEFGLWSAWRYAQGSKRPPRSLGLRLKEPPTARGGKACSCELHNNAAMASSLIGKKLGFTSWWCQLPFNERSKMIKCSLAMACKSEVLKIANEVRASSARAGDESIRSKNKLWAVDAGERSRTSRGSISDSEVDQLRLLARKSGKGSAIASFLSGLQALKELSESGLLHAKEEDFGLVEEAEASRLFDSTLKVAHTLPDRVLRRVRNLLVKVRNDQVELELFGDENSGNLRSNTLDQKCEIKTGKSKKKKRKQSSTQRVEIVQKENNLLPQKLELIQKDELPTVTTLPAVKACRNTNHTKVLQFGEETEAETWISGPQQVIDLVKETASDNKSSSRKGKGGKSETRKADKLNHDSTLESRVSHVNGAEDSTVNGGCKHDCNCITKGVNCISANEREKENGNEVDRDDITDKKPAAEQYRPLPTSDLETQNGHPRKSSRKVKGGRSKSRREQKQLETTVVNMADTRTHDNEDSEACRGSTVMHMSGVRSSLYQDKYEKSTNGSTFPPLLKEGHVDSVRTCGQVWVKKAEAHGNGSVHKGVSSLSSARASYQECSLSVLVDEKEESCKLSQVETARKNALGTVSVDNRCSFLASTRDSHQEGERKGMVFRNADECQKSKSGSVDTSSSSHSETTDANLSRDHAAMNLAQGDPQGSSSNLLGVNSSQMQAQIGKPANERNGSSATTTICFGSFDTVLPDSLDSSASSQDAVPPAKAETQSSFRVLKGRESGENLVHHGSRRAQARDLGNWSEGAAQRPPIRASPNGPHTGTKTSRQLEFANTGVSPQQQLSLVRFAPHEWPGLVQVGNSGTCNPPTASDWLQLDAGRGLPPRVDASRFSNRSTSLPGYRNEQADASSSSASASSRPNATLHQEWPTFVQSFHVPRNLPVPYPSHNKAEFTGRCSPKPSKISPETWDVRGSNGTFVDEVEDKFAYDTDTDDYGVYKAGEFDDFDGYLVSEEEGDRSLDDVVDSSADYNQIFGGGVMYWNAADYAGMGYSRPGSLSSEDSSWARHEADLSVVLDDIVNCQLPQGAYPISKGPTVSNGTSSSPPSAPSVPVCFDHVGPAGSGNSRHGLHRPIGNGKPTVQPTQLQSSEELSALSREASSQMVDKVGVECIAQPLLRPIVVVRDFNSTRQGTSAVEALRLQEAKSPHIVPRSKRDFPSHRRRPPSPVLRCVPPAPPPPPPSPVANPRRRKGFMAARSGSSSPRHWGLMNWPFKDDPDTTEGRAKAGNQEGFVAGGRRRAGANSTPPMHPLSSALLRERLIAVPSLTLEQEHPDSALPVKTALIQVNNPPLYHCLLKMVKIIHVEIEAFCVQVAKENKRRRPFVHTAVKKVAHSLQVLWPRSRTKIFGSIATGLALPTSDVDLVVCLPPVRNLEPIKEAGILEGRNGIKETCLQHAARYLADQEWVKSDSLKTVENTLVPIINMVAEFHNQQCEVDDQESSLFHFANLRKYASRETGVRVDPSSAADVSVEHCKEDLDSCDEELKGPWGGKAERRLVRLDISFEAPSHTGLRTAELVRELVGQFPALSPLALVLKQFLTDRSLDHPYTGGLSSYCLVLLITRFLQHQSHVQSNRQPSSQNLGSLLVDFLHFFGCVFDPRSMGVRIRSGGMFLSRDHVNRIDPLYIEDPLHADNNVGRNCFRIQQCVKAFAEAYALLEKKADQFSGPSVDVVNEAANFELLQCILPSLANA